MFADLLDLVLARRCLGCARSGHGLCPSCRRPRDLQRLVPGVGVVHAGSSYDGAVRAAVIQYKERGRRDLAGDLAALLRIAVVRARRNLGVDVLVTVPSSRAAVRARGGDHLRRLAVRAVRRDRLAVLSPIRLARPIQDTSGLGIRARRENVHGAFVSRPPPLGRPRVLLIDDVVTTGASLQEAARALIAAGWVVVGAAVVAATPRRSTPGSQSDHWPSST